MKAFGKYIAAFAILSIISWGASAEAVLDISSLRQPHQDFYYLHEASVNYNTKEQKNRAYQLIVTGKDLPLGISVIDKVIAIDKNDSESYLLRAYAYSKMKEYSKANEDYKSALMLEPNNPTFYYLRGLNYLDDALNNGFYSGPYHRPIEDAMRMFNKALAIEPNYINAIVGRGDIEYYLGNYKEAIDYYNRVLVLYPQHDIVLAKKEDANDCLRREEEKKRKQELERRID